MMVKTLRSFATLVVMLLFVTACANDDNQVDRQKAQVVLKTDATRERIYVTYRAARAEKVRISVFAGKWLVAHVTRQDGIFTQTFAFEKLTPGTYRVAIEDTQGTTMRFFEVTSAGIIASEPSLADSRQHPPANY